MCSGAPELSGPNSLSSRFLVWSFTIVFAIGCRAIAQHIGWREM
jgi:hypothetical protein